MAILPQLRCLFLSLLMGCLLVTPSQTSEMTYSVKEELTPGTIFGYIVDDSDLRRKVSPDELGNLKFSFLKTGNPYSKYFEIEPKTGVLSVASRIDRETVCSFRPECVLTVSAAVQSELGPFFILIQVHVHVTDVNDNPPTFSQQNFQVTVFENAALGVTFPLPTAYDKDTGTNNTVRDYFLMSGYPTFSLQTTEDDVGNIQTALQLQTNLNREETGYLTVLVGARDGGKPPLTGTLTVLVTVADVNDNYPVFDQYAYNVNVSETTRTDEAVVRVHAIDADIGLNGNITYGFSQQQPRDVLDLFRMNALTGNMFLSRSAENHTGRIYELVVEASDQGSPPKVSRALVRVRVLDTVNSRPDIIVDILSAASGQAEVSEYAEVGKVVAYVSVRDPDSGENGVTVCSLNTKDFELQPLNNQGQYKVILVTNLDRERIWRYDISVRCTDFGANPLENSANFVVIVRDENDNPPVFSQRKYITTIPENQTVGATIVQLTVMDLDVGRNAEVEFRVAGAYAAEFQILDNGTMIATAPLDRELSEKLVVKVLAVDKGYPPLSGSATVFITLEDVNDQAPRFNDNRYSFSVAEDARVGSYVGIVAADDADQGLNADITFMEIPGEGNNPPVFIITKEGVVKTNMPLDREETPVHYFPVVARDGGNPPLSSTTTVTIHVDDVNDNTPTFLYPTEGNDSISIPHTFPARTPITRVAARDLDMGANQRLVYSCASANDSGRLFGVDERSGDLFLQRYLSRGQAGMYVLRVAAHDEGTPQLSNQTLLYVEVYFDNSTLLDAAQAAMPSKAVLTALILVGVVLVVGGVAVTTLLCIRRSETKKKAESNSEQQSPSKLQGGYYIAPGVCESPAFGSGLSDAGGLRKPIPEQAGSSADAGGDVTGMRTVNPYVIMPPHSNYTDADGPPEIIEISRNGMFHRIEDAYPDDSDRADDSHFSTFRSQEGALSPSFRQNSLNRRQSEDMVDDHKGGPDDTLSLSELSCQSTSDSGRGGSEFDVNNAACKDRGAGLQTTSSPIPHKAGNSSFRPRDPDVTFTTFRGESPCSFRFGDSDNDTLTRPIHHGNPRTSPLPLSSNHHLQPHARSLHSVAGAAGGDYMERLRAKDAGSVFRPQPLPVDSTSSDEASSLGRRNSGARRAITPSADISRYGYGNGGWFNFNHAPARHVVPPGGGGENYAGGEGERYYGRVGDGTGPGRTFPGATPSTFSPSVPAGHSAIPTYSNHNGIVPSVEFRGRNNLGHALSTRRHVPDYVNAYSDLDSGDDTRNGGDPEPTEDDFLLPPYPEVLEEEGEGVEVSERSALNFVPGHANYSGIADREDDSYVIRHQSEV